MGLLPVADRFKRKLENLKGEGVGMQELMVLMVIALAIFYLPRMMRRRPAPERGRRPAPLTGKMRLAILLTLFWIVGFAALLQPWQGDDILPFLSLGLGPAAAAWGIVWVWFGFKHSRG